MTTHPVFGDALARLLRRRNLDGGGLARAAAVPEADVQAVLDGGSPSPSLVRRIAPALGLHTPDLFVIAGLPVPDDLAPLAALAGTTASRRCRRRTARGRLQSRRDTSGTNRATVPWS